MKKLILLSIMCVIALTMNAQKVFVENFATATVNGNLEGYNNWFVSVKAADALGVSPKIGEGALFYNGYYGSNVGNVAVLDSAIGTATGSQRISTHWVTFASGDTLRPLEGQKIYAAFMVNFSTHSFRSQRDFFTFEGSKTSSSTRGRIFAKLNTAGTDITFAISKNSSTSGVFVESAPIVGGVGLNHLLVFTYEGVAGSTNDLNTLYIDPDLSLPEAQQTNKIVVTDIAANTDYSVTVPFGINLRQRGMGAQIGGIRVGTSWNSVLLGISSGVNQTERNSSNISATGNTIITTESGNLKVYNLAGKEVLSSKTEGKLATMLSKGLYLVRFVGSEGTVKSAKIEIN
jgi:hypothetical protein